MNKTITSANIIIFCAIANLVNIICQQKTESDMINGELNICKALTIAVLKTETNLMLEIPLNDVHYCCLKIINNNTLQL